MHRRAWALAGLAGLAFGLRVVGLVSQSLWRDEVDAIRFATQPLGDLLRTFSLPAYNGPLYYVLLRPWLALAGDGEFALRFFSVCFGVLAVPLIYRLARRLFPSRRSFALLPALLAATSPYLVWYGQEGKMYTLVVVLTLLSMERYLTAIERGGWGRWLGYVLVTTMAFYTHLVAVLLVPAQFLIFFLWRGRSAEPRWRPWLASMALLTVPYLPLFTWQLPLLLTPAETGFLFLPLHEMLSSLWLSYSLGVVWSGSWWSAAVFVGLLLAAVFLWRGAGFRGSTLGLLLIWLALPILGLFFVSLVRPLYTARYLIFVLPAYVFLLAVGLKVLAARSRLLGGVFLAALLAVQGVGFWFQATTPLKADFRAATDYVAERLSAGDLIVFQIPYGRHSFEYYFERRTAAEGVPGPHRVWLPLVAGGAGGTGEPYRWIEGLYTNAGMRAEEVDRRMAELTAGERVVWLVATEVAMWDERRLVHAWLEEHATLVDQASFVRVEVYRYELDGWEGRKGLTKGSLRARISLMRITNTQGGLCED